MLSERYVQMVGRDETGSAGDLKCSAGWREHFLVSVSDKKAESGTEKTGEVIAADERTEQELQKEPDAVRKAEEEPEIVLDELILSDNNRLVILDYGGGTDTSSVEEAVQGFLEPLLKQ